MFLVDPSDLHAVWIHGSIIQSKSVSALKVKSIRKLSEHPYAVTVFSLFLICIYIMTFKEIIKFFSISSHQLEAAEFSRIIIRNKLITDRDIFCL